MKIFVAAIIATLGVGVGIVLLYVAAGTMNELVASRAPGASPGGFATSGSHAVSPSAVKTFPPQPVLTIAQHQILTSGAKPGLELHALLVIVGNSYGPTLPVNPLYFTLEASGRAFRTTIIDRDVERYLRANFRNEPPLSPIDLDAGQRVVGWILFELPPDSALTRVIFDTRLSPLQREIVYCAQTCAGP